jgi:hypothetical protein
MRKTILLSGLLFATTTSLAIAGKNTPVSKTEWVVVSRPMMACGAPDDDISLRQTLLDTFANPDAKLPESCALLKVGEIYLLDDEQSEADTKIAVKMWAPVCPKGCVPAMTSVYAPPRRLVGIYLRPTKPPKGW